MTSAATLGQRLVRLFEAGRQNPHQGDADLRELREQFEEHAPVDAQGRHGGVRRDGRGARLLGQNAHLADQRIRSEEGEAHGPDRSVDADLGTSFEDNVGGVRDVAPGKEPLAGLEMHPLAGEGEELEAGWLDFPEQRDLPEGRNLVVEGHAWLRDREDNRALANLPVLSSMRLVMPLSSPGRRLATAAALLVAAALAVFPAQARLAKAELEQVTVSPAPGAKAPLDLPVTDAADGRATSLGAVLGGHPALLLPVDYTCGNVCDPMIGLSADALATTGLRAEDRRLVLIGIDPKDDAATARSKIAALWGDRPGRPVILVAEAGGIARLTGDLGYRYTYDRSTDSFAHPAAALLLTSDGRLSRVLSPLALDGKDLRLALTEAGDGRVGTLSDRLSLLCYGFDAVKGIYAPLIGRILTISGIVTIAAIATLILVLVRIRRRQETASREA